MTEIDDEENFSGGNLYFSRAVFGGLANDWHGTLFGITASNFPATAFPVNTVKGGVAVSSTGFYENLIANGVSTNAARQPLDREDEIKIAAFQSLFAADPKRTIETLGEIFKTDSKASETFKQEVLRVLRSPRLSRIENFDYFVNGGSGVAKESATLLRETLVKSFQSETNQKIRREIIYALAHTGDESADALKKLYAAETEPETKRAIINAFGNSAHGFYSFATPAALAAGASNSAPNRKIEAGFLLEIVRTERDSALRRLAFDNWQRFQNNSANKETIDLLANLYDAEADEAFKITIIRALAAKQNQTTGKLMDIAKNDKSDKLRLEAIYSLRNSKDPEVLKFLEDLIK